MANGFTLVFDPDVTQYRRLKITAGTNIMQGTVMDQLHTGSSTADVQPSTASSVTSAIYAVAAETVNSGATSILCALITPRQVWSCDATNTANAAHNGLRAIIGTETITAGTTATPPGNLKITSSTGVSDIASGTAFTVTTLNNTGSDVTGTTGVMIQQGILTAVSTTRLVVRFLVEHAA